MNKLQSIALGIILICLGLVILLTTYFNYLKPRTANNLVLPKVENIKPADKAKENKITTLAFVGDIMLDRGVKGMVNKHFAGDYSQIFTNATILKDYDILFGNLEGPVSNQGNNVGSKYSFRMDPIILPVLKEAGFDIVSFANNHSGDWNIGAFTDTLKRLEDTGIHYTGAGIDKLSAEAVKIIVVDDTSFGFLAFSDVGPNWIEAKSSSPGILLAQDINFPKIINKAKTEVDVLIVSIHWGEEYMALHNEQQEFLAKLAIDSGADVVIGHHPHVVQDVGFYKDKPIFYSLGNFVFDQYFSKETMQGKLVVLQFDKAKLLKFEEKIVQLNKFYQIESITP